MAVAHVQDASNTAHNASSVAKAFTSNNTSGNMLLVAVGVWRSSGGFTDPSLSDTRGNTWKLVLATARQLQSGQSCLYLFAAYNCAAGANTVTATVGVTCDIDIAIHEYSGCATVTARDQSASGSNYQTSHIDAGTIQTQLANEVVFSCAYDQSNGVQTFTPTSGWTPRQQTANPGAESLVTYDQLVSATGTFSNTVNITNTSHGFHAMVVSFADTSTPDDLVQYVGNSASSASSVATPSFTNGAGNLLLLAIARWTSTTLGTISSVTDSKGNTWTLIASTTIVAVGGHGQSQLHLYACASAAAGANVITVSTSSAQDSLQIVALEYSPSTINAEIFNSQGSGGVSNVASGSITLDAGIAVGFGFNQSDNVGIYSDFSGTGWRKRVGQSTTSFTSLGIFDQVLASSSSIEETISLPSGSTSFGLHVIVAGKQQTTPPIMEFVIT